MRFSNVIAGASLAGLALSAPLEKREYTTQWVVEVFTSYTTVYPSAQATPAPVNGAAPGSGGVFLQGPWKHHSSVAAPEHTADPVNTPVATYVPPPVQTVAPTPPASSPSSDGNADLAVANQWRRVYGLPEFTWDQTLVDNAQATGNFNNGSSDPFQHKLYAGSFAQTMMSGGHDNFASRFLSGWLCEVPTDTQLKGQCGGKVTASSETGHHDIIISTKYSKIGCAWTQNKDSTDPNDGITLCDYAF